MTGRCKWPMDTTDGPYGYYTIIIQKNGIRMGCNGPLVRVGQDENIYHVLAGQQEKLIKVQPSTLDEAQKIT